MSGMLITALAAAGTLVAPLGVAQHQPRSSAAGCATVVRPGADVTAALGDALVAASAEPDPRVVGPAGAPQGRVYLPAGEYGLSQVTVPSNVRLEIDPGATLHPVPTSRPTRGRDWGMFVFGTPDQPTRNVTVVAGDGCGGPGTPTAANKPASTDFRGNLPETGMHNMAVPLAGWNTEAMWVLDVDPGHWQVDEQVTGFLLHWALDVEIGSVFSIQNPARQPTGIGPVPGVTSRTTVMMFDPHEGMPVPADEADARLPQRIHVHDHYNILSPSGQGPNQVRSCIDCRFERIFSHGGVALRIETDGIRRVTDCTATGPNGQGFTTYAIVDRLVAEDIVGADGNRAAMLTPHCLDSGVVTVRRVTGYSEFQTAVAAARDRGSRSGGFAAGSRIDEVRACPGDAAQEPHPDRDSYLPATSQVAVVDASPTVVVTPALPWPGCVNPP